MGPTHTAVLFAITLLLRLPLAVSQEFPNLVDWTNGVNVVTSPGRLRRISAVVEPYHWNAGAYSGVPVSSLSFKPYSSPATFCGLSRAGRGLRFNELDYSFELRKSGFANVVERGIFRKLVGMYKDGDTFKIVRTSNAIVRYYYNNRLVYESTIVWVKDRLYVQCVTDDNVGYVDQVSFSTVDPRPELSLCWNQYQC